MIYDTKGGVLTICLPPTSNKSRMLLIWPKINIAIVIAEDGHLPKFWTRCASHTGLVDILPAVKCLATCKQFPYKEIETSLYGSCLRVARHFTRGKMLTKLVCQCGVWYTIGVVHFLNLHGGASVFVNIGMRGRSYVETRIKVSEAQQKAVTYVWLD